MKPERKENKFYKAVNLLSDYLASKGTDEYKNVLISDLIDGFNGSLLSLERVAVFQLLQSWGKQFGANYPSNDWIRRQMPEVVETTDKLWNTANKLADLAQEK